MKTILIVEDDPVIARGLHVSLEIENFKVFCTKNLNEAFVLIKNQKIDLVVLDLGLPDGDGIDFVKYARENEFNFPIIILTARTDEDSVVGGLQSGANDYIKKPFSNREFIARVNTLLRATDDQKNIIKFGTLNINQEQRTITNNNEKIDLNRREFDILIYLIERVDIVVSRESFLQFMDKDGELFDRTIDSHISHLRNKLKKAEIKCFKISSVYGIGYRLERV